MTYLQQNKQKIVSRMLLAAFILLAIRLAFFLQDRTSVVMAEILIVMVALISVSIIFLLILPSEGSIPQYLKKNHDLVLLSILIPVYDLFFLVTLKLDMTLVTFFSLVFVTSVLVIILSLLPRKLRTGGTIFLLVFLPLYMFMQSLYFDIFKVLFSFNEIVTLREGIESSEDSMDFSMLHIYFYLVVMPLSLVFYFFLKKKYPNNESRLKGKKKTLFTILTLFLLVNFNASIPPKTARLHISDHYLYVSVYSNPKFTGKFGATNYLFRDFYRTIVPKRPSKADIKAIDTYFMDNPKVHVDNEMTGAFKDKNLLFLVAESFDYIAVNETLTPNITKLMNEGINFTNHYVPVYPRTTCDSEIIYNTSLIPSVNGKSTCYWFNQNSYTNSLANIFDQQGYLTSAFHSNYKEFYTRDLVYKGLGYDNIYGQHELNLSEDQKRYDSTFFELSKDYIIKKDEDKFMSFVLTLSGHSPYQMTNLSTKKHYDTVDAYYGNTIDDDVKAYIAAQMEADLMVGRILDDLEAKNLLEDTIIIFTTDHYPYTLDEKAYENHTGITKEYQKMKSPLVIWGSGVEHQEITKLSSSFDILPTIANLFDLETNYTHYFGNDVFSNDYQPIVVFKDYSWFDGENYVLYGQLKDGIGPKSHIETVTQKVDKSFEIAKKILLVDYFKNH